MLVGTEGSGTVFVAGCNLRCVFCQNFQISQGSLSAYPLCSPADLAKHFLALQHLGCHNLNWVSPTHVVPQLVEALVIAIDAGFRLPVVYNTNGYERLETLQLLEGIVDIYLPDLKYADERTAMRLSGGAGYPDVAIAAIREMYRQVGSLACDAADIARRGVIVRHLVLPHGLAGTAQALTRLAAVVSTAVPVSLMAQYYPLHHAHALPELAHTLTPREYSAALAAFEESGLEEGWAQELAEAPISYRPDFTAVHPFEPSPELA